MRLIDADELTATLEDVGQYLKSPAFRLACVAAINEVKNAPTVDAVPVDLINRIIEADGSEDRSNAISLLSLIDTWKYVKRKEEMAKHETD